jgi:hypothetical protein
MEVSKTTCTRCGGSNFITLCKNCDQTPQEIRAEAKAEALKDAADRAVDAVGYYLHATEVTLLRAAITQEPK